MEQVNEKNSAKSIVQYTSTNLVTVDICGACGEKLKLGDEEFLDVMKTKNIWKYIGPIQQSVRRRVPFLDNACLDHENMCSRCVLYFCSHIKLAALKVVEDQKALKSSRTVNGKWKLSQVIDMPKTAPTSGGTGVREMDHPSQTTIPGPSTDYLCGACNNVLHDQDFAETPLLTVDCWDQICNIHQFDETRSLGNIYIDSECGRLLKFQRSQSKPNELGNLEENHEITESGQGGNLLTSGLAPTIHIQSDIFLQEQQEKTQLFLDVLKHSQNPMVGELPLHFCGACATGLKPEDMIEPISTRAWWDTIVCATRFGLSRSWANLFLCVKCATFVRSRPAPNKNHTPPVVLPVGENGRSLRERKSDRNGLYSLDSKQMARDQARDSLPAIDPSKNPKTSDDDSLEDIEPPLSTKVIPSRPLRSNVGPSVPLSMIKVKMKKLTKEQEDNSAGDEKIKVQKKSLEKPKIQKIQERVNTSSQPRKDKVEQKGQKVEISKQTTKKTDIRLKEVVQEPVKGLTKKATTDFPVDDHDVPEIQFESQGPSQLSQTPSQGPVVKKRKTVISETEDDGSDKEKPRMLSLPMSIAPENSPVTSQIPVVKRGTGVVSSGAESRISTLRNIVPKIKNSDAKRQTEKSKESSVISVDSESTDIPVSVQKGARKISSKTKEKKIEKKSVSRKPGNSVTNESSDDSEPTVPKKKLVPKKTKPKLPKTETSKPKTGKSSQSEGESDVEPVFERKSTKPQRSITTTKKKREDDIPAPSKKKKIEKPVVEGRATFRDGLDLSNYEADLARFLGIKAPKK